MGSRSSLAYSGDYSAIANGNSRQTCRHNGRAHQDCWHPSQDCRVDRVSAGAAREDSCGTNKDHGGAVQVLKTGRKKNEKVQVFDDLLQVGISFMLLHASLLEIPVSNYTAEKQAEIKSRWQQMRKDLFRCTQTIHTSAHL